MRTRGSRAVFVQVVGHGREARGDDATDVIAVRIHDVEGDGGAEVHGQRGCAVVVVQGDGVGEAVRSDAAGLGVVDAHAPDGAGGQLQRRD